MDAAVPHKRPTALFFYKPSLVKRILIFVLYTAGHMLNRNLKMTLADLSINLSSGWLGVVFITPKLGSTFNETAFYLGCGLSLFYLSYRIRKI